jgi:hypothetical protein
MARVPKEFAEAFERVARHYRCSAEEVEEMKKLARADLENAMRCYYTLARELECVVTAEGPSPTAPATNART